MEQVRITYNGHACFTLEAKGYRTVIDPYLHGMVDGLPELKLEAEAVYCSHGHADHNFTEAVTLTSENKTAPYVLEELESFHDDQRGLLRGYNTVRIFRFGDLSVAHLGDLGHIPEGKLLEKLKGVDCLLIPVGGTYTIDPDAAAQTAALIDPRVLIPMHYRTDTTGFDVLAHLTDFIGRYKNVKFCDHTFVLTKETPKQILIINSKP